MQGLHISVQDPDQDAQILSTPCLLESFSDFSTISSPLGSLGPGSGILRTHFTLAVQGCYCG